MSLGYPPARSNIPGTASRRDEFKCSQYSSLVLLVSEHVLRNFAISLRMISFKCIQSSRLPVQAKTHSR